jgi:transcription initiation factor TFIID subunit 11
MASPSPFHERTFIPANPSNSSSARGRQRPAPSSNAKRGRKPRSGTLDSPLPTSPDAPPSNPSAATSAAASPATSAPIQWAQPVATTPVAPVAPAAAAPVTPASDVPVAGPSSATSAPPGPQRPIGAMEEEVEGEDELLPAMADDDYSAQLSWQSQSKDNLKCVILLSFFYLASTRRF